MLKLHGILFAAALMSMCGCAHLRPDTNTGTKFEFPRDTFAFANETVFRYEDGEHVAGHKAGVSEDHITRRCFIMSRAAVQFWKNARFDPNAPPVSDEELGQRVRLVSCQTVWGPLWPVERRIVFPGYSDLHDFSARAGRVVRANLDSGLAAYFHPRNYRMPFVPGKKHQGQVNQEIQTWLERGHPIILWLYNFPQVNINHVVVAFAQQATDGRIAYTCADPNYTDRPRILEYDPKTRSYSYEKTFFFPGGRVHVRPIYLSPLE